MKHNWTKEELIEYFRLCGAPDEDLEKIEKLIGSKEENITHVRSCFPKDQSYKCSLIMEHYGIQHQLFKLIEELTEAQHEAVKMLTKKKDRNISDFISELADVQVMIDQIIQYYGAYDFFEDTYDFKVRRTLKRIADEQ